MIRWSLSGMETPLAVALVLAGFVAFTDGRAVGLAARCAPARSGRSPRSRGPRPCSCCCCGACSWSSTPTRARACAGSSRARCRPCSSTAAGWCSRGSTSARSGPTRSRPRPRRRLAGAVGVVPAPGRDRRRHRRRARGRARRRRSSSAARACGRRRLRAQRLLPWVWIGALPLLYAMRGVPVLSRYLVPMLPILAWLAWRAVERWWAGEEPTPRAAPGRRSLLGVGLAALALTQNLIWYEAAVLPQVRSFTAGLHQSLVPWGQWFAAAHATEGAIAAPDIGAIGYYSQRRVLDLAGLVTPAHGAAARARAARGHRRELLVRERRAARLPGRPRAARVRPAHAQPLRARARAARPRRRCPTSGSPAREARCTRSTASTGPRTTRWLRCAEPPRRVGWTGTLHTRAASRLIRLPHRDFSLTRRAFANLLCAAVVIFGEVGETGQPVEPRGAREMATFYGTAELLDRRQGTHRRPRVDARRARAARRRSRRSCW